ncbi:long chain base biosynthesis protein 1a-like, partial [Triticum dicoccoides]|uniref:long chain base biosynthesis protein 1a-like n=1 Tax=Triticum dicoccoides TaxID=85692 RepID=UPI0018901566
MDFTLPIVNATTAVIDRVSAAFNTPVACAVVFGVHIDGYLVAGGLLIAFIVFQLSRKSYKPPKKPLCEKEVDELCDEWQPEPLCPPIKEGPQIDTPILESYAIEIDNGREALTQVYANDLTILSKLTIA